jgi:hypothetical protein
MLWPLIFERNKMKKNAGKITAVLLLFMVCMFIVYLLTPVFAVVRSYDQDVLTTKMNSVFTGATDNMFTVTGGRIEIISLFGECTTNIGTVGNTNIWLDATAGSGYDRDFCTSVDIDALGAGDVVRFSNAIDEGVLDITANTGAGQTLSWFCSPGVILLDPTTTSTGAITWYMSYRKIEKEAVVTAN